MTTRDAYLRRTYGITEDRYNQMLNAHDGGCWICRQLPKTRRLAVDHDHKTGKVRGLLCHRCNRALPSWVTSQWLRQATIYLERANA